MNWLPAACFASTLEKIHQLSFGWCFLMEPEKAIPLAGTGPAKDASVPEVPKSTIQYGA